MQHAALIQREMRYTAMAIIGVGALLAGMLLAVGGAKAGYGYWSLVAMSVTNPFGNTLAFWVATRWIPGRPRRHAGIGSMIRFGGTLTATGLLRLSCQQFG